MSLEKDVETSADNVADHVAKGIPTVAKEIVEDLNENEEFYITIPSVTIVMGTRRKQQ